MEEKLTAEEKNVSPEFYKMNYYIFFSEKRNKMFIEMYNYSYFFIIIFDSNVSTHGHQYIID